MINKYTDKYISTFFEIISQSNFLNRDPSTFTGPPVAALRAYATKMRTWRATKLHKDFRIKTRRINLRISWALYRSTAIFRDKPAFERDDDSRLPRLLSRSPCLLSSSKILSRNSSILCRTLSSAWPSTRTFYALPRALDINLILESTFNHIIYIYMYIYIL